MKGFVLGLKLSDHLFSFDVANCYYKFWLYLYTRDSSLFSSPTDISAASPSPLVGSCFWHTSSSLQNFRPFHQKLPSCGYASIYEEFLVAVRRLSRLRKAIKLIDLLLKAYVLLRTEDGGNFALTKFNENLDLLVDTTRMMLGRTTRRMAENQVNFATVTQTSAPEPPHGKRLFYATSQG